jgi:SAM-dependent methyltransferase
VDLAEIAPFPTDSILEYRQLSPGKSLPFADNSIDAITCFDVIEHLPRQGSGSNGNVFIDTMNEFYRVLKPGGLLLAVTPCYPSAAAFTDPTHVNIITTSTHRYFSDDNWARSLSYGFTGQFRTRSAGWYPWTGSWILNSQIINTTSISEARNTNILANLKELKQGLIRMSQLLIFFVFRFTRTHFIWVLEKE